jgi:hypothetical protein
MAGAANLVLGYGEDIPVWIFKPCDLAGRTLPDAERVLLHVPVFLEDHAAIAQKGHYFLDVLHFPSENGRPNRHNFLDALRNAGLAPGP